MLQRRKSVIYWTDRTGMLISSIFSLILTNEIKVAPFFDKFCDEMITSSSLGAFGVLVVCF